MTEEMKMVLQIKIPRFKATTGKRNFIKGEIIIK